MCVCLRVSILRDVKGDIGCKTGVDEWDVQDVHHMLYLRLPSVIAPPPDASGADKSQHRKTWQRMMKYIKRTHLSC